MADPESPTVLPTAKSRESLSQFVARVLDQLSISAWLPAGALVAILLLFGELRANAGDLGDALADIGDLPGGGLVLLLIGVVLGTMVTQAFEFEAIRVLEGYWGVGLLGRSLGDLGASWHRRRRNGVQRRYSRIEDEAFGAARQAMLRKEVPAAVVDVLERDRAGLPHDADPALVAKAHSIGWRSYGPPTKVRWLDDLTIRMKEYPAADHRVLPTRLGNVLRASEDRCFQHRTGALETAVIEVFNDLPSALQSEHDQHRSRLELYCSMVFVLVAAAVCAYPVLRNHGWQVATALAVGSAFLSYRAAVASAKKYGLVLEAIAAVTAGRPRP
ncbi:MAG: hypothetical protein ACRDTH_12320 [Pseudonocardiaceae bacterium]